MNLIKIQKLLEDPNRVCVLATTDDKAIPNAAIYGSVKLVEDKIYLGLGNTRSLDNLRQNPLASLLLFIPASNPLAYQGLRLYLKLEKIDNSGRFFDQIIAEVEANAGRMAANMIQQIVRFKILESRPLVDLSD